MRKLRRLSAAAAFLLLAGLIITAVIPIAYGGASPLERLLRFDNGGNFAQTALDSAAFATAKKSAVFDISKNGTDGIFIYRMEEEKGVIETYWQLGSGNNASASYILIKDGIRYCFAMNADGWYFKDNRVCQTDFSRLTANLAKVLTEKDVNTAELETDLNGLFGVDLSEYFDFTVLPTVIRSLIKSFGEEDFQLAAGYSFERKDFSLYYGFSPANSKVFAEKVNSVTQLAYTNKTRSIVNIAGIAGDFADIFGYDLFGLLFDADVSFAVGAFTGKLIEFSYETDDTVLTAVNRSYGGCEINIDSPQLQALLAKHVVK